MKKFGLILAGCLAFIGLYGAHADDVGDIARAATRRGTNTQSVATRQKSDTQTVAPRVSGNKTATVAPRTGTNTARSTTTVDRTSTPTPTTTNVVARTATPVVVRTNEPGEKPTISTRTATVPQTNKSTTRTTAQTTRHVARTAKPVATREEILKRDFSKCKTVFFDCMDEFCANKDAQLKRCACSARASEFDGIKKQLEKIDDKMLDFNQRLLTVSMDKEDAAALNIATEGEKAFYETKDVSASKKALDAIAKKLNTSFDSSNFSPSLGTVFSWSLDIDSAFDNVDYLQGASTTSKSGTALYSAALPICREMAAEVCSDSDMSLAESSYQLTIEQDCNTVAKTYKGQMANAKTKILESGALLDISRLDVYQKRNADDILTCKRKMLAMLSDSTVCGTDLGKCLDITGQYIDPTTGEAFLSPELSKLNDLIVRPTDSDRWATISQNEPFVSFLNSKKKFLEPAMENCQSIADTVWDAFLDDALAQIKLAQSKKLIEVQRSCTTLTTQCLINASDSIIDFDARALSTFGVIADQTQNAMCTDIINSCTALLEAAGDTESNWPEGHDQTWADGIAGIQNDITYEAIKQTCREVGRACIIRACTSTSGNFGLCENIDTSINRKSIINGTACWDEVLACVASAGDDAITEIFRRNKLTKTYQGPKDTKTNYRLYKSLYNINSIKRTNSKQIVVEEGTIEETSDHEISCKKGETLNCIYDLCWTLCNDKGTGAGYNDTPECRACRLAENIWGNCEVAPSTSLDKSEHNRIKKPGNDSDTTLLYWFAVNTNTQDMPDSCRDTTCGPGFSPKQDENGSILCIDTNDLDSFGNACASTERINITSGIQLCCTTTDDINGTIAGNNCCSTGGTIPTTQDHINMCMPSSAISVAEFTPIAGNTYYESGEYELLCTGTLAPGTDGPICQDGRFIIINKDKKHYMDPCYGTGETCVPPATPYVRETVWIPDSDEGSGSHTTYIRQYKNNAWGWYNGETKLDSSINPTHWIITYGQ